MQTIIQESAQNVNSNAGIFLAKQVGADVSVFRGTVSHLRTKSTADRPLTCVWEVKRAKKSSQGSDPDGGVKVVE